MYRAKSHQKPLNKTGIRYDTSALSKFNLTVNSVIDFPKFNNATHPELFLDYADLRHTVDNPDEIALGIHNNLVEHIKSPEFLARITRNESVDYDFGFSKIKAGNTFTADDSQPTYLILEAYDNDYENYNILSSYFTDTVRAKAIKDGMSVYDYFRHNNNKRMILHIAQMRCKQQAKLYHNLNYKEKVYQLREATYDIYGKRYECTSHRVLIPALIYTMFNATKVLDFSAGWGDRMMAAIACGASYTGIDPNPDLHECYDHIKEVLKPDQEVNLFKCCAEDFVTDEEYCVMYTSPPFFTLEKYTNDSYQSVVKYPTYNSWRENFFFKMLSNAIKYVKNGGHIAINIINWREYEMMNDMIDYMKSQNQIYMGIIWYKGSANRLAPIAIFKVVK